MPKLLKFGLHILADVFYPKYCFGCRRSGAYLCKFCVTQIPACAQSYCVVCNKTSPGGYTHQKCKTAHSPDRLLSAFPYQSQTISDMIITGKYFFVSETFAVLGILAAEYIKTNCGLSTFQDFIICPLPLHSSKRRWRGFNQAEIIANAFEHILNIPCIPLLARTKKTKTQKDLDSKARKVNMQNAFVATQEMPECVILIDDVCTTGQTFLEASKALKLAGAKTVICISIAKD